MSGRTIFPPGTRIQFHTHSREELVVVMRGHATGVIDGRVHSLEQYDGSYVPPGTVHRFANESAEELELFWVYGGVDMIRTIVPDPE